MFKPFPSSVSPEKKVSFISNAIKHHVFYVKFLSLKCRLLLLHKSTHVEIYKQSSDHDGPFQHSSRRLCWCEPRKKPLIINLRFPFQKRRKKSSNMNKTLMQERSRRELNNFCCLRMHKKKRRRVRGKIWVGAADVGFIINCVINYVGGKERKQTLPWFVDLWINQWYMKAVFSFVITRLAFSTRGCRADFFFFFHTKIKQFVTENVSSRKKNLSRDDQTVALYSANR